MDYDVFNGDADGICALHQLRMASPRAARLVTGVKRDVGLLERVTAGAGDRVTVLDISLDRNRAALGALLDRGGEVLYIDHHYHGKVPENALLEPHLDPSPETCTSVIVDRLLKGRFRPWAVVGAFGDNLLDTAEGLSAGLGLSTGEVAMLRELGMLMNYNGYGAELSDLHCSPADLYRAVSRYEDPLRFGRRSKLVARLRKGYAADLDRAEGRGPEAREGGHLYRFPPERWARRVSGVFMNLRAREARSRAHALLLDNGDGTFMVSVRAPLDRREGADTLCRRFPTGGGRAGAAGINRLPEEGVESFLLAFDGAFTARG